MRLLEGIPKKMYPIMEQKGFHNQRSFDKKDHTLS